MKNTLMVVAVGLSLSLMACKDEAKAPAAAAPAAAKPAAAAAPAAAAPAAAPAAAGDSVGVPECDEYITKYSKCLEEKVPAAAKDAMKSGFETMRKAWKEAAATPEGKQGLAVGCKAALDGAKQSMTAYGCTF
jgi:Tfp pilus assembly protein FimV